MIPALRIALLLALLAPASATAAEPRAFLPQTMAQVRGELAGRPFVLALWSARCEPCREELSHWAELQRAHPWLAIVLVATDPPSDRDAVLAVLNGHPLGGVQSWAFADDYAERLRHAVDPRWRGEVPRTYLFDAAHRAEARSGRLDPQWFAAWLARVAPGGAPR